jgi:iron complex outermembrane receptor protein
MKIQNNIKIFFLIFALAISSLTYSQQTDKKEKKAVSREEIMNMTYEQLLNLSFEDLINLAEIMGVTTDELLQMILNKDVSSASKTKEKVFQSPLSTTVLSKEEIDNSGATCIAEALRLVPGMIIREKTPGNYDVHIRGNDNVPPKNILLYSENSMTLVMIDGRPVYNSAFGGTFWETLPIGLNDIERIEVIRGPSSALYGPNAVSGVINIITQKPDSNKMHVSANLQAGNIDSRIANASVSMGTGKLRARISGNYTSFGRFTDKFYHFRDSLYLTRDQVASLTYTDPVYQALGINQNQEENLVNKIPHPDRATNQYGANAFLFYDVNEKTGFDLSLGTQKSDNIATVFGNHEIPMLTRASNTSYFDFKARSNGLSAQVNYMFGDQDYERLNKGFHNNIGILNSSLEYQFNLGKLILRPGAGYQQSVYDDSKYVDVSIKEGYLNGAKNLNTLSYYLRADYRPIDKLRLIAAVRGDKYNKPNKNYFTYQFIGSYELNSNNIIRALYSRANRGPFMVDTYSDYYWKVITNPQTKVDFLTLKYLGNPNLKLPQMDMLEFGYRTAITKNVQVDIEAFHTITSNYSYFMADSMYCNPDPNPNNMFHVNYLGTVIYQNFDLKTIENGVTVSISAAINKQLYFNVFGTVQNTELKNFFARTTNDVIGRIQNQATYMLLSGQGNSAKASIDSIVDMKHKATPVFFGGASITYKPTNKVMISPSFYCYGKQTFLLKDLETEVPSKLITNIKVSYKIWKNNWIYFNARNLFNNENAEFGYVDKIGGTYMVGLNLNF